VRTRHRVGLMATALALVAAGCASESDGDGDGAAPGDGGDDTDLEVLDDPRSDAERESDEAAADEAVLTLDDMPAGWTEGPAVDDENDTLRGQLADCIGIDRDVLDPDNPEARSPELTSPGGEQVRAEVAYSASPDHAGQAFAILARDETPGCYAEALSTAMADVAETGQLEEGVEVGEVSFERLSFPDMGDESTAFRVTIPLSVPGFEVELLADIAAVRVGRVVASGTFLSELQPFDTDEAADLMATMVDRIPADA